MNGNYGEYTDGCHESLQFVHHPYVPQNHITSNYPTNYDPYVHHHAQYHTTPYATTNNVQYNSQQVTSNNTANNNYIPYITTDNKSINSYSQSGLLSPPSTSIQSQSNCSDLEKSPTAIIDSYPADESIYSSPIVTPELNRSIEQSCPVTESVNELVQSESYLELKLLRKSFKYFIEFHRRLYESVGYLIQM